MGKERRGDLDIQVLYVLDSGEEGFMRSDLEYLGAAFEENGIRGELKELREERRNFDFCLAITKDMLDEHPIDSRMHFNVLQYCEDKGIKRKKPEVDFLRTQVHLRLFRSHALKSEFELAQRLISLANREPEDFSMLETAAYFEQIGRVADSCRSPEQLEELAQICERHCSAIEIAQDKGFDCYLLDQNLYVLKTTMDRIERNRLAILAGEVSSEGHDLLQIQENTGNAENTKKAFLF